MGDPAQLGIVIHAGLAVLSMAAFAVARPPTRARLAGRSALFRFAGGWAYWATSPLLKLSCVLGISATGLTVIGMCLSMAAGLAAAQAWWGLAGLLLVWSGFCDMLDGELARSTGTARPEGAFLDSTLDRVGETALLLGVAAGMATKLDAVVVAAALATSLMVSYARARGEGLRVDCPSGGLERPHRLAVFITILLVAAFLEPEQARRAILWACALVAAGAGVTAAGRILAIRAILRRTPAAAGQSQGATEAKLPAAP